MKLLSLINNLVGHGTTQEKAKKAGVLKINLKKPYKLEDAGKINTKRGLETAEKLGDDTPIPSMEEFFNDPNSKLASTLTSCTISNENKELQLPVRFDLEGWANYNESDKKNLDLNEVNTLFSIPPVYQAICEWIGGDNTYQAEDAIVLTMMSFRTTGGSMPQDVHFKPENVASTISPNKPDTVAKTCRFTAFVVDMITLINTGDAETLTMVKAAMDRMSQDIGGQPNTVILNTMSKSINAGIRIDQIRLCANLSLIPTRLQHHQLRCHRHTSPILCKVHV
jgi:hypothetical protein